MIWICTVAAISWEATSAIGTAAAAIVALLVWISGLISAYRRRRANARLLAQLILPEFEKITAWLKPYERRFWESAKPETPEERRSAVAATCATLAKNRGRALALMREVTDAAYTDHTSTLFSQPGVLARSTADALASAHRKITHVRHTAYLLTQLISADDDVRTVEALIHYHQIVLNATTASVAALAELRRVSGLEKDRPGSIVSSSHKDH